MGHSVTQQSGAATGASHDVIVMITARHAVQVGDLLVGSHFDAAPKPLFPRSLVPPSFATATAPGDSICSALTTATGSASLANMALCTTSGGGFAVLLGAETSESAVSLFVFGPDNTLLSKVAAIESAKTAFPINALAELADGGFVMAWRNTTTATGHLRIVYPFSGGSPSAIVNLGAAYTISVTAASDGGFYIQANGPSPFFAKYSAAGVQQWSKSIGTTNASASPVFELANGNVVVAYGGTFAIYSPAGAVVVAAKALPGTVGGGAPLAGGGFVVGLSVSGNATGWRHAIISDDGTVLYLVDSFAAWWLRGHPAGGYVAGAVSGSSYYGYQNDGRRGTLLSGDSLPVPLADGRLARIKLNSVAATLVTEIFAGSGAIYGIALDAAVAGTSARVKVAGAALLRADWNNGGFNHASKSPAGNRGLIVGQSAVLGGL